MRNTQLLGLAVLLCALPMAACEEDDDTEIITLRAALAPLNNPARPLTGGAEVEVGGGLLEASTSLTGVDSVTHIQFIGNGDRCPTASHDTNSDGFIDIQEGMAAFGSILLALDTTLAINEPNLSGQFPFGITYVYNETGLYNTIDSSLRPTPSNDFVANIPIGETLDVEGMTVVVLGVTGPLPRTVATLPGFAEIQTLPVACGVLTRVNNDNDD